MLSRRALITDLDNTLYNWIDFFAPSFRAMVHAIARITRLPEADIIESFRQVYSRHRTLEYSFAIQELGILKSLELSTKELEEKIVQPARVAFMRARRKHLRLYPHVRETLQWAKNQDLLIIGLTDVPLFHAERRLKVLHIDQFFDALFSREDFEVPESAASDVKEKSAKCMYVSQIPMKEELNSSQLKPNPAPLYSIFDRFRLAPETTYMVGDNLWKDVSLAQTVGVHDIWARYGQEAKQENLETLRQITPWTQEEIAKNEEAKCRVKPTHIIDDFS
jgi:phosphoglycolate phosphatase